MESWDLISLQLDISGLTIVKELTLQKYVLLVPPLTNSVTYTWH